MNRLDAIRELGVGITFDYEYRGKGEERKRHELNDKISGVNLPLTPEDWCSIAMSEGGSYVGGCCGNMSLLQDYINGVFRDGGWADASDLLQIGELARGHDGFDLFQPMEDKEFEEWIGKIKKSQAEIKSGELDRRIDPWATLGLIYNAVEPMLTPSSVDVPKDKGRHSEEKQAIHVLQGTLTRMNWADLFNNDDDAEEEKSSHRANQRRLKARAFPLMRSLVAKIEEEGVEFKGFGIVDPENNEVFSDRRGLCIYEERENAERVVAQWERWAEEERERLRKFPDRQESLLFWDARKSAIVPISVTVEDGLKIEKV